MAAIKFKVKLGEKSYEVDAEDENDTVGNLKAKTSSIVNVPATEQKWIFQGRILTDNMKVSESNIKEGSCVILMKVAGAVKSSTSASPSTPAVGTSSSSAPPLPPSPSLATASTPNSASISTSAPTPSFPGIRPSMGGGGVLFDRAMLLLLGNDEATVTNAVSTLLKIVNNIIQSPMEEKFRKVSNKNAAFSKKVGTVPGGPQCMTALGFTLRGDDWILEPHPELWDNLLLCQSKAERFMQRLENNKNNNSSHSQQPLPTSSTASISAPVATSANTVNPAANASNPAPSAADVLALQQLLQILATQQPQQGMATPASTSTTTAPAVSAAVTDDHQVTESDKSLDNDDNAH